MADSVRVTPASRKIEFFNPTTASAKSTISLDTNGNLTIVADGTVDIGDTSADIYVGDGSSNVDIVYTADGEIRTEGSGVELSLVSSETISIGGSHQSFSLGKRAVNNTGGRTILLEGLAASSNGEGSSRIFFTEHNNTTALTDKYGLSLYYQGDGSTATLPSGAVLSSGNATWGLMRHDNSQNGTIIMGGIRGNSNVGFGTFAPTEKVTIRDGDLCLHNPTAAESLDTGDILNRILFRKHSNGNRTLMIYNTSGDDSGGHDYHSSDLRVAGRVRGSGDTLVDRFTIVGHTGNVGIGTTSPGFTLDVTGTFQAQGDHDGNVIIDNTGTGQVILASHTGSSTPVPWDIREASSTNSNDANYGPLHITRMNMTADGAGSNIHFRTKTNDGSAQEVGGIGATIDAGLTASATRTGSLHFYTTDAGTNRQEKMTIKSDGKVGIGTTSPDVLLDIEGSGKLLQLNSANNSGTYIGIANTRAMVGYAGGGLFLQGGYDKHLIFAVNNGTFGSGEVARFDKDNGYFGIGTTTPDGILDVSSASTINVYYTKTATPCTFHTQVQTSAVIMGTTTNHNLQFKANGGVRMTVQPSGNVGINDTTPSYKLDVNGTGRFTGALTGNSTVVSDGAGDGVVTLGETDGIFIQEFHKNDSETLTDALYSNINQKMAAVFTRGNRVTTSGSGQGPSAQEVNGKIYLFNVVMENLSGSNVSDVFQAFDVTIFVSSSDSHTRGTYRRTVKCLYDAANDNLIYQNVDTMQSSALINKIDVEVEYATGDATVLGLANDNIAVARFYINLATLSGSNKWNVNQIDWSWEFMGLKDEAISG